MKICVSVLIGLIAALSILTVNFVLGQMFDKVFPVTIVDLALMSAFSAWWVMAFPIKESNQDSDNNGCGNNGCGC